ncbi:hypothetical protein SUGI_0577410 [Cryptomeria japonica]|nr:hypothetical protein SUGI_0577410 [Cryptomeria japonica]
MAETHSRLEVLCVGGVFETGVREFFRGLEFSHYFHFHFLSSAQFDRHTLRPSDLQENCKWLMGVGDDPAGPAHNVKTISSLIQQRVRNIDKNEQGPMVMPPQQCRKSMETESEQRACNIQR